jgi:hypothetical protein
MVVGFTTTYIQSVLITTKVVSSDPTQGGVYSIQHYVIKFVGDLWEVGGFSTNKTDRHDITEILLKVALNTITITLTLLITQKLVYLQFI